jgi:Domain of unknown function (DUF5658)
VKSAIACAAMVALFAAFGFAADERALPASPGVVAKASATESREQPPAQVSSMSATAVSANVRTPAFTALPTAPSAIIPIKQRPESHRFFDVKNSFALSAVATSLIADALSTQKGLSYPGFYEMNPIARPFVQTRAGAAVYSAGSLGLVAAGMYVAHRTRHHKLERILPFAIAGWEGLVSARNYHVIALRAK